MNELTQAITAGLAILRRTRLTLAGLVTGMDGTGDDVQGHPTTRLRVLSGHFGGGTKKVDISKKQTVTQNDIGGIIMNEQEFPERITLTGFAALFNMSRSTLSAWRATDATRFPKADAAKLFDTVELAAYHELRELETVSADEMRQLRRQDADDLEHAIDAGMFTGAIAKRVKRVVHKMRTGDPEAARLERIAEIETMLTGRG